MAQKDNDSRDRLFQLYDYNPDAGYTEPTENALNFFLGWVSSELPVDDGRFPVPQGVASGYDETDFRQRHTPACLYDIAHVWLAEGNAAQFCPTYESWLLFLIAFADVAHYFRDVEARGWELDALNRPFLFPEGRNEQRLRAFDVLLRDPAWRRGAQGEDPMGWVGFDRHTQTGGLYQHPTLRRDVYDVCAAQFRRRRY